MIKQLRRVFRCMKKILMSSNLQMLQMGRLELLNSQPPVNGIRSMTYMIYTGFHLKPEQGNINLYSNMLFNKRGIQDRVKIPFHVANLSSVWSCIPFQLKQFQTLCCGLASHPCKSPFKLKFCSSFFTRMLIAWKPGYGIKFLRLYQRANGMPADAYLYRTHPSQEDCSSNHEQD